MSGKVSTDPSSPSPTGRDHLGRRVPLPPDGLTAAVEHVTLQGPRRTRRSVSRPRVHVAPTVPCHIRRPMSHPWVTDPLDVRPTVDTGRHTLVVSHSAGRSRRDWWVSDVPAQGPVVSRDPDPSRYDPRRPRPRDTVETDLGLYPRGGVGVRVRRGHR